MYLIGIIGIFIFKLDYSIIARNYINPSRII